MTKQEREDRVDLLVERITGAVERIPDTFLLDIEELAELALKPQSYVEGLSVGAPYKYIDGKKVYVDFDDGDYQLPLYDPVG